MTTMNGQARGWVTSKEEFRSEANDQLIERLDELADERLERDSYQNRYKEIYQQEKNAHERRFILRSTIITAFAHGGAFFDTEWTIEGQFVFRDEEFGPAELLIAESQNHGSIAILSVATTRQEANVINRIQKLCAYISDNRPSIETDLGTTLNENDVYGAIALYGVDQSYIVENLESLDDQSELSPISVWELESGHSERLSLASWSDIDHPLDFVPGGGLGSLLDDNGTEIANTKHVSIDRFSDSHHEKLFKNFYVWLFNEHVGRDPTNSYFSKEELIDFLQGSADQPTREVANMRATELIDWWYEMEMIKAAPNPTSYDDDATVHSIKGRIRTADIADKKVAEYRNNAMKAFVKKELRNEFPDGELDGA